MARASAARIESEIQGVVDDDVTRIYSPKARGRVFRRGESSRSDVASGTVGEDRAVVRFSLSTEGEARRLTQELRATGRLASLTLLSRPWEDRRVYEARGLTSWQVAQAARRVGVAIVPG